MNPENVQEQPWEITNGLTAMDGTLVSTGEAGQMWEFNGHRVGVPWCPPMRRQSWVDANLPMVKLIAEAIELQAWRVYTILSGHEPEPKIMAQLVPGEVLAAALRTVQGRCFDLRDAAWANERSGAQPPSWAAVARMLTKATVADFDPRFTRLVGFKAEGGTGPESPSGPDLTKRAFSDKID